ncbi:MAG: hypothetical protein AUH89_06225 [Ktedonobacter sp. 13_1_40CM_4_52_4]|nr:MAG: hypothetical protein AUH89_06225 [Ktedonobacter sp. 13_1_40CM_4_52_4]
MYSLNKRIGGNRAVPPRPILAAKRRRQLHPFFFSMGPVALCISSTLLIGLMAILYLTQLGQAVTANQRMQDYQAQQAILRRQNQDLVYVVSQEQSPQYIAGAAKALGLVPADPKAVHMLIVKDLEHIREIDPHIQP